MANTPRPAQTGISPGQMLLGKYRVEQLLGQGGMGVVARCTHIDLNEQVALKMLRRDVLHDEDAVERFMREAQAASKLRSEFVARVTDVGRFEDGVPYMVMEFLDGHDLGDLIDQRGTLAVPWAVEMVMQTCEALAEAHSLGIVHRDVKPTNLFVTWRPDGTALVKVLDFGISKSSLGTDLQLTQTQSLLGTPAYMSPEQMRSARLVDARTDIWSLGTVLYELLEGRRPFEADSFSEMCVKVAVDAPAPMLLTPPLLQQVVLRCLAKVPEQRYASMADLARDLIPFAADPHQATKLVERMQRTLGRRTGHERDAASAHSNPSLPRVSTPQVWPAGSDPGVPGVAGAGALPAGAPALAVGSGVLAPVDAFRDRPAATPDREPSAGVTVATRRRSRWPLVVGAIALLGGGITFAVLQTRSGPADPVASPPPAPPPVPTRPPTAVLAPVAVESAALGSADAGSGVAADADADAGSSAAVTKAAATDAKSPRKPPGTKPSGAATTSPQPTITPPATPPPVTPTAPHDPFSTPRPVK